MRDRSEVAIELRDRQNTSIVTQKLVQGEEKNERAALMGSIE